jgi:GNAT superfamily N-acetyltransferase
VEIHLAQDDAAVRACLPVLAQLRPDLVRQAPAEALARIRRLEQSHGYLLAAGFEDGAVRTVAGFRVGESLAWGRFLYVDDLVTDAPHRGRGHGSALLTWLIERAREAGCDELHLDSGVQRADAHRFYEGHGLSFASHHFRLRLGGPGDIAGDVAGDMG